MGVRVPYPARALPASRAPPAFDWPRVPRPRSTDPALATFGVRCAPTGQFTCGSLRCDNRTDLKSWEVNFGYVEAGEKRNALVKLRLCPDCSAKLNYRKKAREASAAARRRDPEVAAEDGEPEESAKRARTEGDGGAAGAGPPEAETVRSHWKGAAAVTAVDRTREEEYEDYFSDLFQ